MRTAIIASLILLSACGREPAETGNGVSPNATIPPGTEDAVPTAPPEQAQVVEPGTLPVAFRGDWAGQDEDCSNMQSDLRLTVHAGMLEFYESMGKVLAVEQAGPDAVIVDASYEGEGQNWTQRQKFTLSSDGARLTIANQGNAMVRKRCAKAP